MNPHPFVCLTKAAMLSVVVSLATFAQSAEPSPSTGSTTTRKIQPNDIILIRVVGEVDLTMERRVGEDGVITYPYLEALKVSDKTPTEVERMVRDGLKGDYLVNPQVTVDFKEYVKQFVNVSGMVNSPGRIELPVDRRLDLMDVLSLAKDLSPKANKNEIVLTRQGQPSKTYKYSDIQSNTDPEKRIYVEPGDQIKVGERIF
jgi:protein involved in polysaccharide export with SLBB domain